MRAEGREIRDKKLIKLKNGVETGLKNGGKV